MNIVFLGTPACALPSLDALVGAGHVVPLVVTRPDRPAGRSAAPQAPPVKRWAVERGTAVLQPRSPRSPELLARLQSLEPDLLVVVAYGRILPGPLLELLRHGAINVHFSLLPRYRGAAPVQWALARGEATTGVTTMQIRERLDEGEILLQQEVSIEPREHAPRLQQRLSDIGAALLVETLERLRSGTLTPRSQDQAQATFAPLLRAADGEADLFLAAREVEGRIRGFDPWPGVWARKNDRRLRLVDGDALVGPPVSEPPGRIVAFEGGALQLVCGEGSRLALHRVQPEGRRTISARDAMNGRQLTVGDHLEGRIQA